MKRVVLDSSYALAMLMDDEAGPASAEEVLAAHLVAPSLWNLEMANAMMSSVRRGRLRQEDVRRVFGVLQGLDVEIVPAPEVPAEHWYDFSSTHGLTPHDAQYLDLALQQRCAIATRDPAVADAAGRLGLRVLA